MENNHIGLFVSEESTKKIIEGISPKGEDLNIRKDLHIRVSKESPLGGIEIGEKLQLEAFMTVTTDEIALILVHNEKDVYAPHHIILSEEGDHKKGQEVVEEMQIGSTLQGMNMKYLGEAITIDVEARPITQ